MLRDLAAGRVSLGIAEASLPDGGIGSPQRNLIPSTPPTRKDLTMQKLTRILLAGLLAVAALFPVAAQSGALTDYAENKTIDALIRAQSIGAPATWYVALYTTCPTDSTAGTEVSGGSYARVAVTADLTQWAGTQSAGSTSASSGTGGTTSNNATISFPTPSAGWGTVVCWGLTDASTSGNIWIYAALTVNKTINSGDSVSFAAGAATIQIDN